MRFKVDLSVNIASIVMKNPIMPASGTFGYGEAAARTMGMDLRRLGAINVKGTTLLPIAYSAFAQNPYYH